MGDLAISKLGFLAREQSVHRHKQRQWLHKNKKNKENAR